MAASNWSAQDIQDQQGRLVIVTGATSGIGKETALTLAGKNASVIIAARNMAKGQDVVDEILKQHPKADISVRELDLTNLESIKTFSDSILRDYKQLDVLINNAGIMMCPYSKTSDGFEVQMGTNHLGHFALTGRLMPLLMNTKNARIIVLSSIAHRFGNIDLSDINWDNRAYNTNKAYGDSKLANLYFAYELSRKLEGIKGAPIVTAAHPGWTATELQRHTGLFMFLNHFFAQDTSMGALPTLRAGFDDSVKPGDYFGPAAFFETRGYPVTVKSNKKAHDNLQASELWRQSEKMTGIEFSI
ncbi:oxidoreductase [Photobacterium sp. OFAV2-7]|uniref:oxidoreductase n=1 Tax=Photobacterium sp. OFAV2-7 TaxID=2917748 RepID=UPI001EF49753|nr:oxidoreductase [Photobacterium sp. OFAV2-7]MCG7588352.1 oxidoreductase [Photobacterium sp. OFAV2-7]